MILAIIITLCVYRLALSAGSVLFLWSMWGQPVFLDDPRILPKIWENEIIRAEFQSNLLRNYLNEL